MLLCVMPLVSSYFKPSERHFANIIQAVSCFSGLLSALSSLLSILCHFEWSLKTGWS